jgi:hypothetical protein
MHANPIEILTNPGLRTVEIETGRFARYSGAGCWETYRESRRGARTHDGPLLTSDVICRFHPDSFERQRVEEIMSLVDGA